MTKDDVSFNVWFDNLAVRVLDDTGIKFRDEDSVREDYDSGKSMYDVADDIIAEYTD